MGTDFTVLENQYKLEVDNEEYSIDILLYHRRLKENNQPIGVATYKLPESLPNDLKGLLSTQSEISERLKKLLEFNNIDDKEIK